MLYFAFGLPNITTLQGLIEADLTTAVTVAANKILRSMLLHAIVGQP